jgi:O-antigen ligase
MKGFSVEQAFPSALKDRNEVLQKLSVSMWKDAQWGGVGLGVFKLQAPFYAVNEDWEVLPPNPELSSNGYFTLLAEQGIVGALLWVVGIGFLVSFWIFRLVESLRWHRGQEEGRSWIFCMPSIVWVGVAVLLAALADAWFSSGILRMPLAVSVAASMALAASSFPKMKRNRSKEDKD